MDYVKVLTNNKTGLKESLKVIFRDIDKRLDKIEDEYSKKESESSSTP